MSRTLISFLGTGNYGETTYRWEGLGEYRGKYAPAAIAALWGAERVVVLATSQARERHGEGVAKALEDEGLASPDFRELPSGRDEDELWGQFEVIRNAVTEASKDELVLDITHGFRAQPFFAGAVLSVLQAAGASPEELRVAYGEYRPNEEMSPIWDLTLFADLMSWSQALGVFLKTGQAKDVVELGRKQQKSQAIRAKTFGDRDFPGYGNLLGAIEEFAHDLATVRAAHIITGYEQDDAAKDRARGSASGLFNAIEQFRAEADSRIPPLALILDRLAEAVRPLAAERLWSREGQRAQHDLASFYMDLERYPEAATVLREARVNLHAPDERAVEVNSPRFDMARREQAEAMFRKHDPRGREIIELRNELNHAGFRKQPNSGDKLAKRVREAVKRTADTLEVPESEARSPSLGRVYFVSRHPGAVEWAREQGIEVDHWLQHIEPESIQAGDIVIGSLPVHLAAQVCARGGRYFHLSLDLPEGWRGSELSAEELRACNARLCEYYVLGFSESDGVE
jgi:CRISPR-associated protein Csx16